MKDIIINDRYRVDYKVGEGGFGLVYAGTDIKSNEEVAMKLMHIREEYSRLLESEAEVYNTLSGGVGVPRVHWVGQKDDYYVLVHDLLGPSLEDLFNYCGRRFSLKTTLLLADQAISRIQFIHDRGFLHCDIKPDNFLMGLGKQGNILFTVDFGLATEFCDAQRDQRYGNRALGGTRRYASINSHCGRQQSRADDLESLGYVLLYFVTGSLPWQGVKAASEKEKDDIIKEKKMALPEQSLFKGLPDAFPHYVNYTRSLGFNDRPDYVYLRGLFQRVFNSNGFRHDNVFDWTEKLFYEMQSQASG